MKGDAVKGVMLWKGGAMKEGAMKEEFHEDGVL